MTKLIHSDLMKLGTLLGYSSFTKGLCQGFSFMWAQALLAEDEERFFHRLELIASYNPNFAALIADCEEAKKKARQLCQLTQKDIDLLEIPAFFDGIEMHHNPEGHSDLFDKKYVNQEDINTIYPIIQSKKLEHSELGILFNKSHSYSKASLTTFLDDLKGQLEKADSELPILLSNIGHSVCLKYSKTKQKWFYIDTNDFSRYPGTATYFRELKTTELVSSLFESLSDSTSVNVLFNMQVLATTSQTQQFDPIKASLALLALRYPVTRQLATTCDNRKLGLLLLACQQGDLNLVQKLLKHPNIEINQANSDNATPLYIACQNGHLAIVAELLKQPKIEINKALRNGVTPLFIACQIGHPAVVAELLKQPKIEINQATCDGATLLYIACQKGHFDVVAELLKQPDIEINQAASDGTTPLYIACLKGHFDVVAELLKQPKIEINQAASDGTTPLYIACLKGHFDVVRELLKQPKIEINQAESDGVTPLYIACQNGHAAVVAELLKHPKIEINQADSDGTTPLYIACQNGHLAVVAELLKQPKIEINQAESNGVTPLYIACQNDHAAIIAELLKQPKIEINQADSDGVPPLFIACENGYFAIVAELLKQPKIEINQATSNGKNPLYIACQNSHLAVVELLLKTPGIDINSRGLANYTPLLIACLSPHTQNNEKLFQLLLSNKASLSHKNAIGQTALDIAFEQNNTAALSVLLKAIPPHPMPPSALMSSRSLEKALCWAKAQCPEVADYLTTHQSKGQTSKFFPGPAKREPLNDESLAPRNCG